MWYFSNSDFVICDTAFLFFLLFLNSPKVSPIVLTEMLPKSASANNSASILVVIELMYEQRDFYFMFK